MYCMCLLPVFIYNGYLHLLLCLKKDILVVNIRYGYTGDLNTRYNENTKVFEE